MELCSIASGSSGNCIYVGSDHTHLLVDVGISKKKVEEALNSMGLKPEDIHGILITHEHSDHVAGLGIMARRYGIPIYASQGTIEAVKDIKALGDIDAGLFNVIRADERFRIEDITIAPVRISHDAREPVAYRLFGDEHGDEHSVGVLTDLGRYDDYIVNAFFGVEALLIEANHDVNMLSVGKYPYALKQRILGDKGHLSNESCGRLLCELLHDNIKRIMLGHLSKENNLAELAYETVRLEIMMDKCPYKPEDFHISVAGRQERSELIAV
ncbi:MAG: MBL fold metallo-hydrolase [Lachnospiraceae bacterium]|nr:MBL fold metallo-hydrolase [Lachnospiraceae bacterium]